MLLGQHSLLLHAAQQLNPPSCMWSLYEVWGDVPSVRGSAVSLPCVMVMKMRFSLCTSWPGGACPVHAVLEAHRQHHLWSASHRRVSAGELADSHSLLQDGGCRYGHLSCMLVMWP